MTKFRISCWGILFVALVMLMGSCSSSKDILYFQGAGDNVPGNIYQDLANYEIRIMPHDNLYITVSTANPLAAEPYNLLSRPSSGAAYNIELQGYLVNEAGDINFPELGKVHVAGLTKTELVALLQNKISQTVINPVVNVRFMNYKISVLGEVNRPGVLTIKDERVSLPEALALAGDLTIYGRRHDVLVCRIENGEQKFYHVDITKPDIFYSDLFYLKQNDVVYVQPNKARMGGASVNPLLSVSISVVTLLFTAANFVINLSKK